MTESAPRFTHDHTSLLTSSLHTDNDLNQNCEIWIYHSIRPGANLVQLGTLRSSFHVSLPFLKQTGRWRHHPTETISDEALQTRR